MEFNPYSIPPFISLVAIFSIGLLAYRQNPRSPINTSLFHFCLSLCFWLFNFFMMYNCKNKDLGLFWVRIGFFGNPFIPLLGYIFVYNLLDIKPIPHLKKLFFFAILSVTLFNTDFIYAGIKNEFWGPYPIAGRFYFIYSIFFFSLFLISIRTLYIHMLRLKPNKTISNLKIQYKREEIKYVFFAFIVGSTGIFDFIAKYNTHIYPFGWLSALLFISLICYAILKHQILENELLKQEIVQSDKLKSIAVLASGMAHEIKNPLTPIKTFSELLPARLDDKEFLLKFSGIINKEVDRIDGLVQDLLNFAKPSEPQLENTNIPDLIQETLELLNNEIIRHNIKVNASFEGMQTLIKADPKQLKQALLNLLLNAIEAMPAGGVLSVASEINKNVVISISDTGSGIAPEDLRHIFDPFFTKKDNGTGLGLSITHEIIRNHKGKITAESEKGKGTAFRIELPL